MPSHVTHTSNSSGKARVYRDDGVRSSRSPSVYSPTSSDSHSSFSSSDHSWTHVSEDDILPSESASHPARRHQSSRRRQTEAPQAPAPPAARHPPSRSAYHHEEEPPRHRSRKSHRYDSHDSHDSRERREHREHRESRREPSNGSSHSTEELAADDYPFGRHGGPAPYPPVGAYRHGSGPIPPSTHGGYPPSMPGAQGYTDPFQHPGALVHRSQHDPFGYPGPGSNPFAPGPPSQNPFSPHGYANPESYFQADSQHPQMNPQMNQQQRPPGPSHRSSMYGPGPGSVYSGSELVPSPYGFPGMAGMPPHMMQSYAMHGYPYPPSHHASPPPPATTPAKEEKKEEPPKEIIVEKIVEKKDDAMIEEVAKLRALIKQQEDERIAREKAIEAEALAKKLKAEQEALKKQEIDAASAAAKAAAEKAAEEAAKVAKEEADKKLAEAEAAKAELEKKQKELEEAVAKNKPLPDMEKAPIKFKDAVGRKFSFPWHLCKTWKGMESLIKQAFLHVDVIGQHVQEGHYDLMGPDGEIILPQVWDTMIKPDWEVSMHMWPIPETPKKEKKEKEKPEEDPMAISVDANGVPIGDVFAGMTVNDFIRVDPVAEAKAAKKAGKSKDKTGKAAKRASAHIVEVPPAPPAVGGSPPGSTPFASLPAHVQQAMLDQAAAAGQSPMVVDVVDPAPVKKKKKPQLTGFAAWMAGQQPKPSKKDDEKLERSASSASSTNSASFNQHALPPHHSHQQTLYTIPIANGNGLARRRRSTAGSSWTTASASGSLPVAAAAPAAKVVAKADQGSCAVM